MELTEKQKKRVGQAIEVSEKGNLAIAKMLFELHDRLDDELPAITDLMKRLKGDKGDTYVMTDEDKEEIAELAYRFIDMDKMVNIVTGRMRTPLEQIAITLIKKIPKPKNGITPSKELLISIMKPLIPPPVPGEPGADADEEVIFDRIVNALPVLGEKFRDGLELLQDDERLDQSAIKNLIEEFAKIWEAISELKKSNEGRGGAGGVMAAARVVQVSDLSDQCNGVLKTFYVPLHSKIVGLRSTQFPIIYRPNVDFTTANHQLTLTDQVAAVEAGQTLIFEYIK